MKLLKPFAILLAVCFYNSLNAQLTYDSACAAIKMAERNIIALDEAIIYKQSTPALIPVGVKIPDYRIYKNDSVWKKKFIEQQLDQYEKVAIYVEDTLLPLLGIGDSTFDLQRMEALLECIEGSATLDWLEYAINLNIERKELRNTHVGNSVYLFKKIRASVRKRLNEVMEEQFTFYKVTEATKKPVKGLYIDHMNDFFFPAFNDDRDMTGSFKIEIFTDWLKLRIMSPYSDHPLNFNGRNWYSYQSLVIGGEGYTGYLRDPLRYNNPMSVDSTDRPFASTIYFGRAKYRLFNHGFYKVNSLIRIGSIGAGGPDKVQSTIHRDITIGSLTPNGWGAQIAAGGRLSFNYEVTHEKMILSKGLFLTRKLSGKFRNVGDSISKWFNLSVPLEFKIGHEMTSLATGVHISNMNFKESGGIHMPFINKPVVEDGDWLRHHVGISYRYMIRRVFRNPLLEGYGIFKHSPDEDPASPIDRYILTDEQVNRWIQIHELNVSFRLKFVAVIIGMKIWSPEFNLPVNSMRYTQSAPEHQVHNTHPWNHVGKVGLLFGFE